MGSRIWNALTSMNTENFVRTHFNNPDVGLDVENIKKDIHEKYGITDAVLEKGIEEFNEHVWIEDDSRLREAEDYADEEAFPREPMIDGIAEGLEAALVAMEIARGAPAPDRGSFVEIISEFETGDFFNSVFGCRDGHLLRAYLTWLVMTEGNQPKDQTAN